MSSTAYGTPSLIPQSHLRSLRQLTPSITSIYLLPPPLLPALISALQSNDLVTPSGRWSLTHHLFRSTDPISSNASNPSQPTHQPTAPAQTHSYHNVLTLSIPQSTAGKTYVHITSPPPGSTISIPPPQTEQYVRLIHEKFGPLWMLRSTHVVQAGFVFSWSEFVIRVGEVKQVAGLGGAGVRAGICAIQTVDEKAGEDNGWGRNGGWDIGRAGEVNGEGNADVVTADGENEGTAARDSIREFWQSLGIEGAKEFVRDPDAEIEQGLGGEMKDAGVWCDALRLRP